MCFKVDQMPSVEQKILQVDVNEEEDDFVIFIAVHVGAGFHSQENTPAYQINNT